VHNSTSSQAQTTLDYSAISTTPLPNELQDILDHVSMDDLDISQVIFGNEVGNSTVQANSSSMLRRLRVGAASGNGGEGFTIKLQNVPGSVQCKGQFDEFRLLYEAGGGSFVDAQMDADSSFSFG
jgi:hypothetical protein